MTNTANNKCILCLVSLFIICFSTNCTLPATNQNVIWHQHYQAIEDGDILSGAWNALEQATAQYGPPRLNVEDIHIRRSVAKSQPALLSRADIIDWPGLAAEICQKDPLPTGPTWTKLKDLSCAAANQHDINDQLTTQLAILRQLNRLITADAVKANHEANRRFIEALFPQAILVMPAKQQVQQGLELCEMITNKPGQFVLYIPSDPGEDKFFGELNHEVFHLLNNRIYDWYMEGLASVFSEQATEKAGNSWQEMRDFLAEGRRSDPYAISYLMMKELSSIAEGSINNILDYAVATANSDRMHIDIDAWLETVDQEKKTKITAIINSWAKSLGRLKGRKNSFSPPSL